MKKRLSKAAVVVISLAFFVAMGCSGSSGGLQTQALAPEDKPVVVDARDQQPTDGPTGDMEFKIKFYDPSSNSAVAAKVASDTNFIDYQAEYRRRVANVGATFWDDATGEWRYGYSFEVINGEVVVKIKGIIPGTYRVSLHAVSERGIFNLFYGNATVTLKAGERNYARMVLESQNISYLSMAVAGLPDEALGADYDRLAVQVVSIAENSDILYSSPEQTGYFREGWFYFWAEIQLNPSPATKLQYSIKDQRGKVYVQEINFNILDLIDGIIATEDFAYRFTYEALTDLTMDVLFPDQVGYAVSLTDNGFPGYQDIGIPRGAVGVEMLSVSFTAKEDSVLIDCFRLAAKSTGSMAYGINWVTIWDGSVLVGSGAFAIGTDVNAAFFINPALRIPAGSTKTLAVQIDIASDVVLGDRVRIDYIGSSGVDEVTGEMVEDSTVLENKVSGYIM